MPACRGNPCQQPPVVQILVSAVVLEEARLEPLEDSPCDVKFALTPLPCEILAAMPIVEALCGAGTIAEVDKREAATRAACLWVPDDDREVGLEFITDHLRKKPRVEMRRQVPQDQRRARLKRCCCCRDLLSSYDAHWQGWPPNKRRPVHRDTRWPTGNGCRTCSNGARASVNDLGGRGQESPLLVLEKAHPPEPPGHRAAG